MWAIRAIRSAAQAPTIVVASDGDLVIGHPRVGHICTEIRSPGTYGRSGERRQVFQIQIQYLVENKCPAREYSTVQHYGDLLIVELVRPDCRLVLRLKGLKRLIRQFTVLVRPRNGAETFYR